MKIVYGHQIFTRQAYGGVSRYIHEISRRIPALQGDATEVFAPLHVNAYLPGNPRLIQPSRRLRKFRGGALLLGAVDIAAGFARVRVRKDVDIFHASYYPQVDYRPRNSGLVVTVYDMIHEREPGSFSRHDPTARLKRRAVSAADHVICISKHTQHDLIEILGVPAEKTSVIHLGHSLTCDAASPHARPQAGEPFLLYVGNRGGYKNFALLLHAFAASQALRDGFAIVCFGGGPFTAAESAAATAAGLPAGRLRHAQGSDDLLSSLYASASAFVYPSLYEGFGIPPLEAMAHGCPVLCARASSLPEVAGPAAEYFDPLDPGDLARAIERVVGSPAHARALVDEGFRRVVAFSWDKCAAETLALYRRINGDS